MHPATPKASKAMSGLSFTAFVLSVAGWALGTAWLFTIEARSIGYVALVVPGLIRASVFIRKLLAYRQGSAGDWDAASRHHRLLTAKVGWPVVLLAVGAILGAAVLHACVFVLDMSDGT